MGREDYGDAMTVMDSPTLSPAPAILDRDERRLACLPPLSLEVLDTMSDPMPGDITLGEVYRAIAGLRDELKEDVTEIRTSLQHVVYQDVFQSEITRLEGEVRSARGMAFWALGVMLGAVLSGIVAIVVALNV